MCFQLFYASTKLFEKDSNENQTILYTEYTEQN